MLFTRGSLSTFNPIRCRVLPKRHNPSIGITLRSISSNLAFHQSAVDVVWRKVKPTKDKAAFKNQGYKTLAERLIRTHGDDDSKQNDKYSKEDNRLSLLLLPFPLNVKTKDFKIDTEAQGKVRMLENYKFFQFEPYFSEKLSESQKKIAAEEEIENAIDLIIEANKELSDDLNVDVILLPETSLSSDQYDYLKTNLEQIAKNEYPEGKDYWHSLNGNLPSILISGVRESKEKIKIDLNKRVGKKIEKSNQSDNLSYRYVTENDINFPRNAVYCQYLNKNNDLYYDKDELDVTSEVTPKYKQYKHHRWQLERSQIKRYGLSSVLSPEFIWWESIKIPRRRVSFLNVGDKITISHLICEDLARQDPIAELIRHVGPSLVVALLMDGPQLKNRWSARYATVFADDPGSSVITLTSFGMVKRHSSEFGLMSRVIALWNESGSGYSREIELAQGAEAVLLTLEIDAMPEKTADGREEGIPTSILRLVDVIQIYPKSK